MITLTGHDQAVTEWVCKNLGVSIYPPYTAIGWIVPGGVLVSGAVFYDFNGSNIETTIYGRMTRQTIKELFRYVFDQVEATRLTARTKRENKRMQCICVKMGFKYEATQPRFFGPDKRDDGIVFRIFRSDAERWLI